MKTTKKAISILLTILMVVGMMSTFAFAEGETPKTGSITVMNPQSENGKIKTYTAYKIFDATYETKIVDDKEVNTGNYSYTIKTDSKWYSAVKDFVDTLGNKTWITIEDSAKSDVKIVKVTQTKDGDTVTSPTASDVAKLATALDNALKDMKEEDKPSGTELTYDETSKHCSANGLDLGFYFVTTGVGTLAAMTTTDADVTIYDKNESDGFDKSATKINEVNVLSTNSKAVDANIGDVVTFQITVKVPSTQGYVSQTYTVKDIMSTGLTYNESSLEIAFKDVETTKESAANEALEVAVKNPTGFYAEKGLAFKKLVDMTKLQDYIGKTIVFTYTATVNENAVDVNTNTAGLVKNNPDGTENRKTPDSEVKVYTGGIEVIKVDSATLDKDGKVDSTTKKLEGAKFILKKKVTVNDKEVYKYYQSTLDNDKKVTKVEWVDNESDATVLTTDEAGKAAFSGIAAGTYYLEETQAPDGYNPLNDDVTVKVERGASTERLTLTSETVANSTGTELPETGGIGTTVFYLLGAILVVGAGVVFVTRRRMHAEK